MTFDSAQFVDSGRTEARGAAAGARSRSAGDFQVEQVCHLAAALRKGAPSAGSPKPLRQPGIAATIRRNFHYYQKGGGGTSADERKGIRNLKNGSGNCADRLKKTPPNSRRQDGKLEAFFSLSFPSPHLKTVISGGDRAEQCALYGP